MKHILICPGERPEVPLLAAGNPLATVPALGHGLVEYWMSHLACSGTTQVTLLAGDRPNELRKIVGNGSRWGITAEVVAESSELTAENAAGKHGATASVMDHFPGLPDFPLFTNYAAWFKALQAWMPRSRTPHRVGVREVRPGIWVGLHGHIARDARLEAPCWLGDHVYVGSRAVIGPETIVENGSFIEPEAVIRNSVIGPSTFVGRYMRISNSLVWGGTLLDWQTGVETKVNDAFLLCSLEPKGPTAKTIPLLEWVSEWFTLWKEDQNLEPQPVFIKKGS